MDLTISLPNHVSEKARKLADELGISVDQLFALAINHLASDFGAEWVTESLDAVYAHEPSAMDPALVKLQSASIGREEW
jgi:hypothetical protein